MGTENVDFGRGLLLSSLSVIILEVLGVGDGVVGQRGVGDELMFASLSPNIPISHTSTDSCTLVEASHFFVVSTVFYSVKGGLVRRSDPSTLLGVLTIVDHVKADSESLTRPLFSSSTMT